MLRVTNELPRGAAYTNTRPYNNRGWYAPAPSRRARPARAHAHRRARRCAPDRRHARCAHRCWFETRISELTKDSDLLLDLSKFDGEDLSSMRAGRSPMVSPEVFAVEMREGVRSGAFAFTAGADEEFVIDKYRKGFIAAFEQHTSIQRHGGKILLNNLGWGAEDAKVLARAVAYAKEHCEPPETIILDVFGNDFGEADKELLRAAAGGKFAVLFD